MNLINLINSNKFKKNNGSQKEWLENIIDKKFNEQKNKRTN